MILNITLFNSIWVAVLFVESFHFGLREKLLSLELSEIIGTYLKFTMLNQKWIYYIYTYIYRNLYRHKSIPGVDFLVGISRYLSEGQEFREFFTLSGTLSSQASVISDSGIHFNILLLSLIRIWNEIDMCFNNFSTLTYLLTIPSLDHFCHCRLLLFVLMTRCYVFWRDA